MKKLSAARRAAMALAGSLGASALAQQAAPDQVIAFLDKDGDGKCSLNEYLTFQAGRLAQFDADGDGVLQYGEFRDSLQGRARQNAQRSFDAFNIEENRKALTRREFLGYHAYVFKQFVDADGDGFMSAAEWEKIVAAA
jgi:Ca2+-binding EF-hand superfamily protein